MGHDVQLVEILDITMPPQDLCVVFEVGIVRWESHNPGYHGYLSDNEDFFYDPEEFIRTPMLFLGASKQKEMSRWKLLREIRATNGFIIPKGMILFLPYESTMLHKLGFWVDDILSFNMILPDIKEEHKTFEAAALLSMASK